jgi:hypothetical protein
VYPDYQPKKFKDMYFIEEKALPPPPPMIPPPE